MVYKYISKKRDIYFINKFRIKIFIKSNGGLNKFFAEDSKKFFRGDGYVWGIEHGFTIIKI